MNVKTIDLLQEINPADYLDARIILAVDNSENDADHEAAISSLIRLTKEIPVPFAVQGRIKRLEDVKKDLYAGAYRKLMYKGYPEHVCKTAVSRWLEGLESA